MKALRRELGGVRLLAAWVLLAMVLLRGLIPAGMMPDVAGFADGRFDLVICSAEAGGGHAPAHPAPADQGPHDMAGLCPFAAALALFGPVLVPVLLALVRRATRALFVAADAPLVVAVRRAAWSARAPPCFA